jgi:hypothetical protein
MLLYALTILVSAFLLFQVQPMIAKIILPWFGGSAAVWSTCLLFFQVALLLGYLYAYGLARMKPKAQAAVHALVLGASLLVLPALPGPGWKPSGAEDPAFRILALLTATIGLPYFLLATTGPLLQAWYSRRHAGAMPYRLYALSNAGSMFGLLSYPILFEPFFTTRQQALGWSAAYAGFALLCALAAFSARGAPRLKTEDGAEAGNPPGARMHLYWLALPACATLLLLAVSNHLAQNVAAIPFLWVLPLSIYLLSFILSFDGRYRRDWFLRPLLVALAGMAYVLSGEFENTSVKVLIPLFALGLFVCCMVCHGELARLKPHPRYLTSYYLMIALGGAMGGAFVALAAPRLFRGYYELQVGLAACAVLILLVLREDRGSALRDVRHPYTLLAGLAVLGLLLYLGVQIRQSASGARVMARNFYGGLRVDDVEGMGESQEIRKLTHGTITHGEQFLDAQRRRQPTTYYGPDSGVGLAIREGQERGSMRVGVIGLGVGTLATYGRPGDYYRFYEINPLVIEVARREFTFLRDCRAELEIALGDARLSLEREPPARFDVLAVDAFSSDAIPVHLLTREAFEVYFSQMQPDGVLAVHVSNKYLDLVPVVRLAADSLGKEARVVDTDDEDYNDIFGATWVLVTARPDFFDKPLLRSAAAPAEGKPGLRLWTDDYSNLFQILK